MKSEFLSEIELYYSTDIRSELIVVSADEYKHMIKVMRHNAGDEVYVTDGKGIIYQCTLVSFDSSVAEVMIKDRIVYKNDLSNIILCLPYIKSSERFEFALEKCTELGITQFIVFTSQRTLQRSPRIERWNKIVLAAMKQSLRSWLPEISTTDLTNLNDMQGEKIIFDQNADVFFSKKEIDFSSKNYLLIGPEGGFHDKELNIFSNPLKFRLTPNRLRSETAAVVCTTLLI